MRFLALFGALSLLAPGAAWAGACCVGSTSSQVGALGPCEAWGVGVSLGTEGQLGSWDAQGRLHGLGGSHRLAHRLTAFGALRPDRRIQLGATVPLLLQHRAVGGLAEWGGGPADVQLWTRLHPFEDVGAGGPPLPEPGFVLTLPTGIPVDRSPGITGAGATGTGLLAVGPTLRLGRTLRGGAIFGTGSLQVAFPHPERPDVWPGLAWDAGLVGSAFVNSRATVAFTGGARGLTAGWKGERRAGLGSVEPWLGASLTGKLVGAERLSFGLRGSLPVPGLGRSHEASLAATVSWVHAVRGSLRRPQVPEPMPAQRVRMRISPS